MSLSNSQYEAIEREYERNRDSNRRLLEARRSEVYSAVPAYRELDESVGAICAASARQMLDGDAGARAALREKLADISKRRSILLTQAGFPSDYLDPVYTCADCRDSGYITDESGARTKCRCFRQRELSVRYAQSNIQDIIKRDNFSTLSYEYYQGDDLQRFSLAVEISRDFVENFKKRYRNLFFYGTVGTGKSFLSGCIANELLQAGFSVIYFSASGFFDRLAGYAFDAKSREALQSFYEDIYQCDLLIIDDLGTEMTNSFVTSQLFSCLNERGLRKKSVIISTNLNLEDLRDRYSDRIFSRVTSSFSLCKLTGPDIRIYRKRMKNH